MPRLYSADPGISRLATLVSNKPDQGMTFDSSKGFFNDNSAVQHKQERK